MAKRSDTDRWGKAGRRAAEVVDGPSAPPTNEPISEAAAGFASEQLRAFVERIERLEEEKKSIADDIRDVFAEAKGNGFDTKALREILRRRKADPDQLAEHEAIGGTYMHALGMIDFDDTPLGQVGRA